jgi:hypothetical protein
MNFYKALIYSMMTLLIGGAGYYFHLAGVPDLIIQNASGDPKSAGVSAMEVFSGTYECTSISGCGTITRIVLQDDTTMDIIGTNDGQDFSLGQGTWGVTKTGSLIFTIQIKPDFATSSYPSSLVANKISSMKIWGFSKKKTLLPGMNNPIFTRVKADSSPSSEENQTPEDPTQ